MDHPKKGRFSVRYFGNLTARLLILFCTFGFAEEKNATSSHPDGNLSEPLSSAKSLLPPSRSSVDGTLNNAAVKLKSAKLEDRVGAAKLLGKYPGNDAGLMLIGALDDPSELVRRAALVSIVEHFNNGAPIYEQALAEKIFSTLADPDVEVRREVSALIPRLVPGLMRSGMERIQINGRTVFRSLPGRLRDDLALLVEGGLLDSDSIVRQNILKHHYSLRIQIKPEVFGALLEDDDIGVLLVALDQVRMYAKQPAVFRKFEELSNHPDSGVRAKLAKTTLSLGRSFPEYRKVLRLLTNDRVDDIATLAAVDLARLGERVSDEMVARIIKYLSEARGLYGKAETLFYSLSALGKDGARVYQSLLSHSSPSMRSRAWERHLNLSQGWKSSSAWIPALEDRDLQVREAVIKTIRGRVQEINEKDLQYLIQHQHGDVRVLAAELLLVADKKLVEDCYFDLLIDDQSLVRSTTLRVLSNLRIEGWVSLHARSLNDDEYNIQRAAMDGLLGDRKEGVPVLLEFVRKYPAEKISSLARRELQNLGVKP